MRLFRPAELGVGIRVAGTGAYLPKRVVSNAELRTLGAPLTEEEMVRLSGIQTRHWAAPGEATSDLAVQASVRAMRAAGVQPEQVQRLVLGTVSQDYPSPSTACAVQHALGLKDAPAVDVVAACAGFLYALDAAARALATGDEVVLAAAAEVRSRFLDVEDRATCALFGDGAAAAVLTRGPVGTGLLAVGLLADGAGVQSVYVPAGGTRAPATAETVRSRMHFIRMADGPQVYFHAVEGMTQTAERMLKALELGWDDLRLIVPHQPNRRLLDRLVRMAGVPPEKVVINVERVGNTAGASCALAFHEALTRWPLEPGDKVLILAAGAGYTAGAALVEVDEALLASSRSWAEFSTG